MEDENKIENKIEKNINIITETDIEINLEVNSEINSQIKSEINSDKKKFKLTKGQQRAVDVRDSNVLVAAAAGSGKTKVLVDRIMGKVTDKDNPVNVDEFLVVTFTNAAAAQMRDKIREKLKEALELSPENEHLSLQQLLVNRADICTIDSFCLKLVKENFNMLDIDSSFTIGDPGMMEMVKAEIMDELFERLYDEGDSEFKLLVDIFGHKNNEEELKKAVSNVYYKSSSSPVPYMWIDNAIASLVVENETDIENLPWIKHYLKIVKSQLNNIKTNIEYAMELCELPAGPDKYMNALSDDLDMIQGMIDSDGYQSMFLKVKGWSRLATCKGATYDKELIDKVKAIRESYKKSFKEGILLKKSAAELVEELQTIAIYLIPLLKLTRTFSDEYMQEKKLRRMFEFSDIEHFAHSLVCSGYDDNGKPVPSALGKSISENIHEIYIDEYQDSNFLQEDILSCVSGNHRGKPNMFMVGDVKQSIYRFRMARPDLFIDKYESFGESGDNVKILLNNNFRSRAEVLLPTNYFFYQLMGKDLGDIDYDESVSLVPTMEFPAPDSNQESYISKSAEVLVLNLEKTVDLDAVEPDAVESKTVESKTVESNIEDEELENMKNLELEAHMIAARIKRLVDSNEGLLVYDEETKDYRRARYKDIVILTRSMKDVGEQFYNVLTSYDIPVYVSDPKGYFDAVEIQVVMSLLSVVDNSKQDIPLASVLLSPIGGLDEGQLAKVCNYSREKQVNGLYDRCQLYMLDLEDNISHKLNKFFGIIDELKSMKSRSTISELLWAAFYKTGYYTYVSAMPMGHRRKANLDMLLEKADAYENGYYKGLFNFLRYVEKLKINQVDFGEAAVVSDDDDVVRIMTMHASKGLEYPIVFVSALGKQFNKSDYKDNLIINSDYYLAMKYMNPKKRYSKETFIRETFKEINKTEGIAEELRILYVALTRAKEKLIITGHTKKYSKLLENFADIKELDDVVLPYFVRKKAQSFMELIIACMMRFDSMATDYQVDDKLVMKVVDRSSLVEGMVIGQEKAELKVDELYKLLKAHADESMVEEIRENFTYSYPYQRLSGLKSKMSVSDIKKQKAYNGAGFDESEFEYRALQNEVFEDAEPDENISVDTDNQIADKPKNKNSKLTGAMRGTIMHKCMELIDFAALDGVKSLYQYAKEHKASLKSQGIYDDTELKAINCNRVTNMLKSNLGQRMIRAAKKGQLFKEQQFSIGFDVKKIFDYEDLPDTDDIIIVQGIVDGYFVEDGAIVVMDYKTDACDEETLISRYKAQLDYYGDTLSRLRGLPVKEKIMYSFYMDKEVPV